jgi:hypothetical protein
VRSHPRSPTEIRTSLHIQTWHSDQIQQRCRRLV